MSALTDADIREALGHGGIDPAALPGEQKSIEWLMERVGYCSGSRFADVQAFTQKGASTAKRDDYIMDVVIERLTGQPTERYVSVAMQWGIDQEPAARMRYESITGAMVEEQGFIRHPTIPMCGGSVDGFVGTDGIIEIKAPTTRTHLRTLLSQECEHLPQIMGYLWITGRQWADFISYDPRLPKPLDIYIQRIPRDDVYIAKLAAHVQAFLAEVQDLIDRLKGK